MAERLSAMEREVLEKLMRWYEAQQRGFAVKQADDVLAACKRLDEMKARLRRAAS